MKVTVTGEENLERYAARIVTGSRAACRVTAEKVVEEITTGLRSGKRPDGSSITNEPETRARKGGRPPGVQTGRLADGTKWRIRDTENGAVIQPPADRVIPAVILDVLQINPAMKAHLDTELASQIRQRGVTAHA